MTKLQITTINGYRMATFPNLAQAQLKKIVPLIAPTEENNGDVLGGRRDIRKGHISGIGPVVVKFYARGGLNSLLVKETYVRSFHKVRSLREFEWLKKARNMGIPVPKPIAGVWRGSLLYKCWLVMEDIGPHDTLAQISLKDKNRMNTLLPEVRKQIDILLHEKIFHVDLHPGNILVDKDSHIYIIDFDKARHFKNSPEKLKAKYTNRWERALRKHGLPDALQSIWK